MKTMKMSQVKENIFYNKRELLELLQSVNVLKPDTLKYVQVESLLNKAHASIQTREDAQLFYSIIFSFGDIQNREHNIFAGKKTDKGGESLRKFFIYAVKWMAKNQFKQFVEFIPLISEYTNFENLWYYQVRTKGKKIIDTISIIDKKNEDLVLKSVVNYLTNVISSSKTNDETHQLIAKFLNKPRFSKRGSGDKKYKMQDVTFAKEVFELKLAELLSESLGWEVTQYKGNKRFFGLEKYKAKYNQEQAEVLFSTGRIKEFTKQQFMDWLDKIPSTARFHVQRMIIDKDNKNVEKWGELGTWYKQWIDNKSKAAQIVRDLETKAVVDGNLTIDEEKLLATKKKESKVTTGARDFLDLISSFYKNKNNQKELDLVAQQLLAKITLEVPILTIADISGSMNYRSLTINGVNMFPRDLAGLFATLFLAKNPHTNTSKGDLLIRFDDRCDILYTGSNQTVRGENKFMANKTKKVDRLYNTKESFIENWKAIDKYMLARNGTHLTALSTGLKQWVDQDLNDKAGRIEMIQSYPVWLIISDGDLNNSGNAKESIMQFKQQMKQWFGWDGVLVIWDMKTGEEVKNKKFEDVENVMYFPSLNIQTLTQVFTKIHDLDVIDIYTPLNSLFQSNRYDAVKAKVLKK